MAAAQPTGEVARRRRSSDCMSLDPLRAFRFLLARPAPRTESRIRDREIVNLQQVFEAMFWVESAAHRFHGPGRRMPRTPVGAPRRRLMADANAAGSSGEKSTPSTPCVISSVNDPRFAAIGAVPAAIASTTTKPKGSSQTEGTTTARAADISSRLRSPDTNPASSTDGLVAAQSASSRSSGTFPGYHQAKSGIAGPGSGTGPRRPSADGTPFTSASLPA